jgi:hypothetical protein
MDLLCVYKCTNLYVRVWICNGESKTAHHNGPILFFFHFNLVGIDMMSDT